MDQRDIRNIRIEVVGNHPPFELKLEVTGVVDEPIDDSIIEVGTRHWREMAPDIAAALEREVLRRVRIAGQPEDFEL